MLACNGMETLGTYSAAKLTVLSTAFTTAVTAPSRVPLRVKADFSASVTSVKLVALAMLRRSMIALFSKWSATVDLHSIHGQNNDILDIEITGLFRLTQILKCYAHKLTRSGYSGKGPKLV